jgi:hypothetical protein
VNKFLGGRNNGRKNRLGRRSSWLVILLMSALELMVGEYSSIDRL